MDRKRPAQRRYLTARERVAQRRAQHGDPPPRRRRVGCVPLGAVLALLLLGLVGVLWSWAGGRLTAMEQADPRRTSGDAPANLPAGLDAPFNVLLLGIDRRGDLSEGVRSDTLILVHVNPTEAWAGMLSIPRDSVVDVPGLGLQKINTAYSYGYNNAAELYGAGTDPSEAGAALAAETVEGFLGLPVDYTAQVDFQGFERIVDTVGGIRVTVERPLLDPTFPTADYGYERLYIPAGLQVFDGQTALQFARSRHSSSDFDRAQRQQQVLQALLAELRARGFLDQAALVPALARDLEASVATTLPISDLATLQALAAVARDLTPDRIVRLSVNPDAVRVVSMQDSSIFWDPADVADLAARLLVGPDGEVARIQVLNATDERGLAGRVSLQIEAQGFLVNPAGDAPQPVTRSMLIDYGGRSQTLNRLAEWLAIDPGSVYAEPPPDAPPAPFRTDIVLILGPDYRPEWAGR
jgi:LCP family protein required for cell wall assembly